MAVLTNAQRKALWAALMSDLSAERVEVTLSKAELRAGVDAVDQWINDNAASFNAALPAAVQSALTAKQKLQLFMLVARRRYEVS